MAYDPPIKQTINGTNVVPTINAAPQANVTGTVTTATSTISATDLTGIGSATILIYGTYAGVNVTFEVLPDVPAAQWVAIQAQNITTGAVTTNGATGVLTTNSINSFNITPLLGVAQVRVRATAYTSGTATVVIHPSTQFVPLPIATQAVSGTVTANLGTGGTGATNLGKAEDAVHTTGDVGIFSLTVRNDGTATTPASANGDYQQLSSDIKGTLFTRDSPANTATLTNVTGANVSTAILAANTNRRSAIIYNDSASDMYINYGAAASSTAFTVYVPSLSTVTIPGAEYSGAINGIWITATGSARVTETAVA